MKKIFSLFAVLTLSVQFASAQDDAVPIGFVNAVGLASKTDFRIDGKSLKPAGFGEGAYASSFGISEGTHEFTFTNGDCEKVGKSIEIKTGSSPLYILYKVDIPQKDGTVKKVLKLTGIPQQTSAGKARFFAYSTVEGRRATMRINDQEMSIEPLKLVPLEGESVSLPSDTSVPTKIAPREPANYVVVIFEGSDLHIRWAFVEMTH